MLRKGRFLFLMVAIIEIAMYVIPVNSEVLALYREEKLLKENSIEATSEEVEKDTNENNELYIEDTAKEDNEIEDNNSENTSEEKNSNEENSSVQADTVNYLKEGIKEAQPINVQDADANPEGTTIPEGYSEFVSDETKKWSQNVEVVTKAGESFQKWMGEDNSDGLFLVGHYQFNYTGGSAIPRGALSNQDLYNSNQNEEYYSRLSRKNGYEWVKYFEQDKQSEDVNIPGNSSAGKLVKKNNGDTIYKAYLVVSQKRNKSHYHLKNCPITLIGPEQKYITTIMQHIENPNTSNRYVGYMDVTDFVKNQGYGEYICCNVPYEAGETDDQYASWRLIVIEENTTKNEQGENNLPLRALNLKLGAAYLSANKEISVNINKEGIKSLNTDQEPDKKITGQLFYSVDGADETNDRNKLTLTIEDDKNSTSVISLYDKAENTNWKTTIRTKEQPLHYILTRNGIPIETTSEYGTVSGKDFNKKYKETGYSYSGADADLIDIEGNNTDPITIPSSASGFTFKFATGAGVTLQPSAIGFAVDIEGTDYETTIKTQNVEKKESDVESNGLDDNKILVTGSATNIKGNNGTGLYNTKTIIDLDEKINNVADEQVKVKAFFIQSTQQSTDIALTAEDGIEIESDNIKTDGNKIAISWGRKEAEKQIENLTLYGDKMTFEIEGLEINDGEDVSQCVNTVEVTGNIYASGVPVDTPLEMAPSESKVIYEDIKIDEMWKDDGYAENRPDSITVDIYNKTELKAFIDSLKGLLSKPKIQLPIQVPTPIRTFDLSADDVDEDNANKWTETLRLASEEDEEDEAAKTYSYAILKKYNYEAKNGKDKYASEVQITGGDEVDLSEYSQYLEFLPMLGLNLDFSNSVVVKDKEDENQLTLTTINTLTGTRNITVNKIWNDYNNIRNIRPDSIKVELLANNESISEDEPNSYVHTLNSTDKVEGDESKWSTKFEELNKYDNNGKVIEYTAKELALDGTENIEGYVGNTELDYNMTTEEGKKAYINSDTSTITITNSYAKNLAPELTNNLTKVPNIIKFGTNSEIIYELKFNTTISDFIGDAKLEIVDELPFDSTNIEKVTEVDKDGNAISENEFSYNTTNNTVSWTIENGDLIKLLENGNKDTVINTYKNGDADIELTKYIKVNYKDIDINEEQIENKAKGTILLKVKEDGINENSEIEGTSEANAVTNLTKATLTIKYKDGETGSDLKEPEQKEVFVGDAYTAEAIEIEDYDLVTPLPENKEGIIKEGDNEVIFYYRKKTYEVNAQIVNGQIRVTKEDNEENDSNATVIIHENAKVEYEPEEGYYVSKILINGKEQEVAGNEKGGVIELKDIKENYNIAVFCEKIEEKVEEIQTTGEKDITPKTGEEKNINNVVALITMLSISGIILLRKKL